MILPQRRLNHNGGSHIPQYNCLDSGVFRPLLGFVGSLQAAETLNLLLDKNLRRNNITLFDAFGMAFKQIHLRKAEICSYY